VRTSIRQAAIYDEYVAYLRDEHGANLVSHWPLDEGPGATTARDVVGGYDGTHNGGVRGSAGKGLVDELFPLCHCDLPRIWYPDSASLLD